MATFKLEITTPDGIAYQGEVEHVRAPGSEGSFGVLKGHTPFITPLQIGEIEIRTPESEILFATSGGLADVRADTFLILAETAERANAIDVERARAARERAQKRLDEHDEHLDMARARAALMRAANRLKLSGTH